MLERIGSVGKWRCTDCGHDFISEKRPRPTRCPKPGCRAPANGHKRAAKPRLPKDVACKRCGIREARPARSECVPCAWDRRRVQRELYWKRKGMAVPPDHSPGVDVTEKLISTENSTRQG